MFQRPLTLPPPQAPPTHTHPTPSRTYACAMHTRLFVPPCKGILAVSWAFAGAKAQYVWNLEAEGKIKAGYAQGPERIIAFSWIRPRQNIPVCDFLSAGL